MDNEIIVTRLGNCTDLWFSLPYNYNPQCTFGGFRVNLCALKKERQDIAVLSGDSAALLNQYCVVADPEKNPKNLTVGQLYNDGIDVDIIFDPLSPDHFSWDELGSNAARLEKISDPSQLDQSLLVPFVRLEMQLRLQADAELQRELEKELTQNQKKYQSEWVHFHNRIKDFWLAVGKLCLEKEDLIPYNAAQAEWLNSLYFANAENKQAYIEYLFYAYEDEKHVEIPMSKRIDSLRRKLSALAKHIQSQDKEREQGRWRADFVLLMKNILVMWNLLWPADSARNVFLNCPVSEKFTCCMHIVDSMIQSKTSKQSLIAVVSEVSPEKQVKTIEKIRKVLQEAQREWKNLMSKHKDQPVESEQLSASENSESQETFSGIPKQYKNHVDAMIKAFVKELFSSSPQSIPEQMVNSTVFQAENPKLLPDSEETK